MPPLLGGPRKTPGSIWSPHPARDLVVLRQSIAPTHSWPALLALSLVLGCGSPPTDDGSRPHGGDDVVDPVAPGGPGERIRPCADSDDRDCPRSTANEHCPSGDYTGSEHFDGPGICLPAPPRGTPEDACPSGRRTAEEAFQRGGICLPELPRRPEGGCPDGWLTSGGFRAFGRKYDPELFDQYDLCQPPFPPLVSRCPAGTRPSLGTDDCVRSGTDCPASEGGWPTASALREAAPSYDGDIVYARPGASAGDGSREAPYGDLQGAIGEAAAGDIVALARGTHRTRAILDHPIALVGACTANTRLRAPGPRTSSPLLVARETERVRIANLGFASQGAGVDIRESVGRASLADVRMSGLQKWALRAGGDTVVERIAVDDIDSTGVEPARGILVEKGASLTLENGVVDRVEGRGIEVRSDGDPTSEFRAADLIVRRAYGPRDDGTTVAGLLLRGDAHAELKRAWFVQNRHGIDISGAGASAEVRQGFVRGARRVDKRADVGVHVADGATFDARFLTVELHREYGVVADGADKVAMQDATVRRTVGLAGIEGGYGILAAGSSLELHRLALIGNTNAGVFLRRASEIRGTDVVSFKTRKGNYTEITGAGQGFLAVGESRGTLRRVVASDNQSVGIHVLGEGTSLQLRDAVVRESASTEDSDASGLGIAAVNGRIDAERALVERTFSTGLFASRDSAEFSARDVVIRSPGRAPSDPRLPTGVFASDGAEVSLRRNRLVDLLNIGIVAVGGGTDLKMRDVSLRSVGAVVPAVGLGVGERAELHRTLRLHITEVAGTAWLSQTDARPGVVRDLVVTDTKSPRSRLGDAISLDQTEPLEIRGGFIGRNAGAGVAARNSNVRLVDTVVTENDFGLVRQGESNVEAKRSDVLANRKRNRFCRRQCYAEPPPASELEPSAEL